MTEGNHSDKYAHVGHQADGFEQAVEDCTASISGKVILVQAKGGLAGASYHFSDGGVTVMAQGTYSTNSPLISREGAMWTTVQHIDVQALMAALERLCREVAQYEWALDDAMREPDHDEGYDPQDER